MSHRDSGIIAISPTEFDPKYMYANFATNTTCVEKWFNYEGLGQVMDVSSAKVVVGYWYVVDETCGFRDAN